MAVNWDDFKIADQQPQRAPVNWDDFKIADQQAAEPSGLVRRALGDTAVSLAKGVIGAGESAIGLANLPTAGGAGKLLEGIGYDPKAAKETLDTLYSSEQQRANQAVQQASGFMGKAGAMLQNPSTIAQSVAESVPLMLGGGAIAQGLGKAGMLAGSPVMRGAIGEGLTGAGLAAEGTRQETEDGMLTPGQVGTSLASGAGTALIGAAGGKIAQKLGIGDVDTMLAQGAIGQSAKGRARRFVEGAISEGVLEEMPQSAQEQVWQNLALGRPWDENVPESAATGLIAGLAMGGGAGALPSTVRPAQPAQPVQPLQPAIDPNAGPLSKAASMATQTPELNPLAFTPMEPTGPELETDAQTQERLRAAQFQADALPFEPSLSFEQEPQPVRATTQDGMPFERIGPQDYDTLNPIRVGEGELLDAERPTAGRTRAPDVIEGQAQQRIGVADDGQQGNQAPMRTLGERVQPAQGDNAPTRALPYFTDKKAEQSARKALPFANEPAAQKKAAELSKKRNEPFTVIPHPALADRFAVVPFRNLRTPNEQGQAAQLAATAPLASVQTQPATESVTNGLPPAEQTTQEAEAARGQEGAAQSSIEGGPASWVIRNKETGEAVMETFDRAKVDALNTKKYEAVPILQHLQEVNRSIKAASAAQPQAPQATSEFDVSTRTDEQLRYLTVSGKPGWKEAAQTELARRQGTPQGERNGLQEEGRREEVAPKPKNLLQLVRKAGGVSMNRLSDVTGDNNPRRAGAVGVFTKNGMDLDGLAELLQQNGFMTEAEVSDIGSGAERATELLRQALAGERPISLEDVDNELSKQEERKYRDRIRQRANEMGIRTAVRKFEDVEADVLAQEEQAALAPEDRSAYALDLAGYNEQTPAVKSFLDDAFDPFDEAAEGQSVEAAMRSLGFTEEEINAELQAGKGAQEAEEADARGTQSRDGSADARQADQGQGQQEGLTLDGYTNADIAQRESDQRARDEAEQQAKRDAERRAQADSERGSFTLTGSDRPADLLAAQGQGGLFDAPQQPAKQSPSDRFRAEVERRKQEREGPQQAQEQPKQAEQARPVYQQTFDQWLEQKWAAQSEYHDSYLQNEGGNERAAKFAAASGGGNSEASARRAYWSELMNAPRDADVSIEIYDGLTDAQKYDASRHFFKMDDVVRDRLMRRAERSSAESERIERDIIGPMQAELDRLQAMNERTKSGTSAWNQRAKEAGQLEYKIAQLRAGRMSVDDLPAKWKEGNGSTAQEAQPEYFPVNPELESLFESLDGASTRKANKAKKAIQADPRADKINMVQDKFLDILQALEDSGAVKINCK